VDKLACLVNAAKLVLSCMGTAQRAYNLARCKASLSSEDVDAVDGTAQGDVSG
jgi:hypothetical protein